MNTFVVDASVAVKWFLPEIHSLKAIKILKPQRRLLAPELIWAEVANTLWKKNVRREITTEESANILKDFLRFPLEIHHTKHLMQVALHLASELNVTVYDGIYLALAVKCDCKLITADQKLYEKVKQQRGDKNIFWIEDVK